MSAAAYPRLIHAHGLDERTASEIEWKGWYLGAVAELKDGRRYQLFFYDPTRLRQDLEQAQSEGRALIAEPGMVVVPVVTLAAMESVLPHLLRAGYFDSLAPIHPIR